MNRDKEAIQYHYDVSNEFYSLWLDENMVYSCAYFAAPDEDIDTAQARKLDYLCRKLRLQAGESLLDIGCGWGALIIHAARCYGVKALGITLSEKQAEYARQRIQEEGLQDLCHVELMDYREVDEAHPFDKVVSVGMVEHVGPQNMRLYFEKVHRLLRPGGVFLNHGITVRAEHYTGFNRKSDSFVQQYIFPDGDIQPVTFALEAAEQAHFEIRDVENLREHYALTLQRWFERYEANKQTILDMMGQTNYRLWRIYLAGARWLFVSEFHSVHQSLLYKLDDPTKTQLPLQRSDWYER
jgi:cyclopropane-fatty-acyl-phospholipid synthase